MPNALDRTEVQVYPLRERCAVQALPVGTGVAIVDVRCRETRRNAA